MSIAFDAVANGNAVGNISFSHTCTGSSGILIVGVNAKNQTVTGVTYNSLAMTLLTSSLGWGSGPTNQYLYYLIAPSTGSHTVAVTVSGSNIAEAISISYTGVNPGVPDSFNSANGSASSISTTVTTIADNCWVVAFGGIQSQTTATAGTGFTMRSSGNDGANNVSNGMEDTNGVKTPAGAVTTAMNFGASAGVSIIGVSLASILSTSGSDTVVTSDTEAVGIPYSFNDSSSASDSTKVSIGFNNRSKNSSTFTNRQKS